MAKNNIFTLGKKRGILYQSPIVAYENMYPPLLSIYNKNLSGSIPQYEGIQSPKTNQKEEAQPRISYLCIPPCLGYVIEVS